MASQPDDARQELLQNLIMSVGTHRGERPLSPVESAEVISSELARGVSMKDLASELLLEGPTMLSRLRKLLDLPAEIRGLVDWRRSGTTIRMSTASQIARLPNVDEMTLLARGVFEHELTKSETQQIVELVFKTGSAVPIAIEQMLKARPKTEHKVLFIGSLEDREILVFLKTMSQSSRDQLLRSVIDRIVPADLEWSSRLGVDRYMVSGGIELSNVFEGLADGFEAEINNLIAAELRR